ncbi:MAG: hypothetical protein OQK82_07630 [Candidatus Pacearchaeota archaeon]|nr:hypothetical protein [Candidatus Pacearchaeota archaeon]
MHKKAQQNIKILITIGIIIVLISGSTGYLIGKNSNNKYKNIIDDIYPSPPEEVYSTQGHIIEISENLIIIRTQDFKQFLPEEKIEYIDLTIKINEAQIENLFAEETLNLSSLKIGDYVSINTKENLRESKEATATSILILESLIEINSTKDIQEEY